MPEIIESLKASALTLLEASPGAGKTTRVPAALYTAGYGNVLVLEPRRLACRMAARHVAKMFGQQPGGLVGFQVRFEAVGSANTKIWYVTEGVLTRKLLAGDRLLNTQAVILDEFHERHLETDLALSLLLLLQRRYRPELKILLMSATLGAEAIRGKLPNANFVQSPGRLFAVRIEYKPYSVARLEEQVTGAVSECLKQTTGDVLVFLPGAAEIRDAIRASSGILKSLGVAAYALHGDLPSEEQDRAVERGTGRKVIFSTNVAESSITIEGVDGVVDSGLARVASYSPWSGLPRLTVEKVSQASVIQRSGRAGRLRPGFAIRLFTETDFHRRAPHVAPELVRTDLSPTLLQLSAAGIGLGDLWWLDPPPEEHVQRARELLERIGALDRDGAITSIGREMSRLSLHPRLARFLVAANAMGAGAEAADLAARLSESRRASNPSAQGNRGYSSDLDAVLESEPSYAVKKLRDQITRSFRGMEAASPDPLALEKALLLGFPDRVAKRRGDSLLLSIGGSARLDRQSVSNAEFMLALEIEDRSDTPLPLVRMTSEIKPDWLLDFFPDHVRAVDELVWNAESERVERRQAIMYDAIVIDETRASPEDRSAANKILLARAKEAGIENFVDRKALDRFLARVRFAQKHSEFQMPDGMVDTAMEAVPDGAVSFAELRSGLTEEAVTSALESLLPMKRINDVAPAYVQLPSGRRARIVYHEDRNPSVASRLQDFFGLEKTPAVAFGKVPLVVELLAPNHRPVQVTTDLASFWRDLYPKVRRELSRRYPKHSWPETPA